MKTKTINSLKNILCMFSLSLLVLSCETSSTEDEFNSANKNVKEKYIKRFQIVDYSGRRDSSYISYTFYYGSSNRVSSATDDEQNIFLNYDNSGNLVTIIRHKETDYTNYYGDTKFATNSNDTLIINDLMNSPYDAFKVGNVIEYDDNANPYKIEVYKNGYESEIQIGEILYDSNPNPFFYTLKAAGIIDILDMVKLNFGNHNPSITKAREILPYNNIKAMFFKNMSGFVESEVHFDYIYDEDNYPTRVDIDILEDDEIYKMALNYFYK
jgi:hypothetical protein